MEHFNLLNVESIAVLKQIKESFFVVLLQSISKLGDANRNWGSVQTETTSSQKLLVMMNI